MSGGDPHVLSGLSSDNRVIAELTAPELEVLTDGEPAAAIPPRAEKALQKLAALQGVSG